MESDKLNALLLIVIINFLFVDNFSVSIYINPYKQHCATYYVIEK